MAASTVASRDPLAELIAGTRRDGSWLVPTACIAVVLHIGVGVWGARLAALERTRAPRVSPVSQVVEIDLPKPPPPAPKPELPPAPAQPAPAQPAARAAPPPAAPAQAAAVVTKTPDPNEPLDMTDTMVTGSASTFVGGQTSTNGTGTKAVHEVGPPTASSGRSGSPVAAVPTGPDRSRRPEMIGGTQWSCPFPLEADAAGIDDALVTVRVSIDASGTPRSVAVLTDPGHGFGREAQRCAMAKRWAPALDHDGIPLDGTVTVNVRFDR